MCNYSKICSSAPIAAALLDNPDTVKAVCWIKQTYADGDFKVSVKNNLIVSNTSGA